jgi:uncharacterized protein (UPF0276 family)
MTDTRPLVGLLYNPASPELIARAPDLVEYLAVMPDRLWYDFGPAAPTRRFHRALEAMQEIREFARGRTIAGHGIGMSLPSAMPLDEDLLAAVGRMSRDLGPFEWFSEHLSVFIAPRGTVPNAQAGLGLPVAYDEESYRIVSTKLARLREVLGCPLALETGAFFTPMPDCDLSEPQFLNRLHDEDFCETLLDLHNIYVGWRNGGPLPTDYVAELDSDAVIEIHLAGGDEFAGFYMDSHCDVTPPDVWDLAYQVVPGFENLRAITFEFQETYADQIGMPELEQELVRMHALASACEIRTAPC